jgi:hypothetical protein
VEEGFGLVEQLVVAVNDLVSRSDQEDEGRLGDDYEDGLRRIGHALEEGDALWGEVTATGAADGVCVLNDIVEEHALIAEIEQIGGDLRAGQLMGQIAQIVVGQHGNMRGSQSSAKLFVGEGANADGDEFSDQ